MNETEIRADERRKVLEKVRVMMVSNGQEGLASELLNIADALAAEAKKCPTCLGAKTCGCDEIHASHNCHRCYGKGTT